jgi:hypothetical protein
MEGGFWVGVRRILVVVLGSLVLAGGAQASSIFYIRSHNIWVAAPDGSSAHAFTSDGTPSDPYDFVSAAKSTNVLVFHRGGNSSSSGGGGAGSRYGTIDIPTAAARINPYNAQMTVDNQFFTRINANGSRVTWAQKQHSAQLNYFAASVGSDGSNPSELYNVGVMDARNVSFGDPGGNTLLFTDVGTNYTFGSDTPCGATDDYTDILVRRVPAAAGSDAPPPADLYCANDTILSNPALSPDGQSIAAAAESTTTGSSGRIVTFPVSAGVGSATDQTPLQDLTAGNAGDSLPDFSPDGAMIAFQGPGSTIDTIPAGGGAPHQILTDATVPAWSPYSLPGGRGGSGGTGGAGHLRLTLTAANANQILRRHALTAMIRCNLACAVAVQGGLVIGHQNLLSGSVLRHLSPDRPTTASLPLKPKELSALRRALRHHVNVHGVLVAVAQSAAGERKQAQATFRVRG